MSEIICGVPKDSDYGRFFPVSSRQSNVLRPTHESNPEGLPDPLLHVSARFIFSRDGRLTGIEAPVDGKWTLIKTFGEQSYSFDDWNRDREKPQ